MKKPLKFGTHSEKICPFLTWWWSCNSIVLTYERFWRQLTDWYFKPCSKGSAVHVYRPELQATRRPWYSCNQIDGSYWGEREREKERACIPTTRPHPSSVPKSHSGACRAALWPPTPAHPCGAPRWCRACVCPRQTWRLQTDQWSISNQHNWWNYLSPSNSDIPIPAWLLNIIDETKLTIWHEHTCNLPYQQPWIKF